MFLFVLFWFGLVCVCFLVCFCFFFVLGFCFVLYLAPKQFTVGFSVRRKKSWPRYALAASRSLSAMCPPCVCLDSALAASPHFVRHVSALCPPCVRLVSALCPHLSALGRASKACPPCVSLNPLWPRLQTLPAICPPCDCLVSAMCTPCARHVSALGAPPNLCLVSASKSCMPLVCLPRVCQTPCVRSLSAMCPLFASSGPPCVLAWTLSVRGLLWGRAVAS